MQTMSLESAREYLKTHEGTQLLLKSYVQPGSAQCVDVQRHWLALSEVPVVLTDEKGFPISTIHDAPREGFLESQTGDYRRCVP